MEDTQTLTNGKANKNVAVRATSDSAQSTPRRRETPAPPSAIAGEKIQRDQVERRWSTEPTTYKALLKTGTGKLFSRTNDGKFVYIQISKKNAKSLDGLPDLPIPDDQQGMAVYQVWLTTF